MATGKASIPNEIVTIPLTINSGSGTGSGEVKVCGRIAVITAVFIVTNAGTNIGIAWLPGQASGQYAKYAPSTNGDHWLSCDYYGSIGKTCEAWATTEGIIKVSVPQDANGKYLKVSGTWITKG